MNEPNDIHPSDQELALVPASAQIVPKEGGNIAVTALEPEHMQQSQAALVQWAERKVAEVGSDAKELSDAAGHARSRKWQWRSIANQAAKAQKRLTFYEKVLTALKAGYCIVPNFPVALFAIRTKRGRPESKYYTTSSYWNAVADKNQTAQLLPVGEGEYQPARTAGIVTKIGDEKSPQYISESVDEWGQIDFPINMAKLEIMEATTNAMAMKIFDQFGVLPSPYKKADPVIVAQLLDPRGRMITFMVAWHLDTRVL